MSFELKVESEKLLQQFDNVQFRVSRLEQKLPEVFLDWQSEDMNRKYPKVDEQSGLSVTTLVYPRSRRSRSYRPNTGRKTNHKAPRRVLGKRPILRPFLVEMLFKRMVDMCKEAIEWR